MTQFEVNIEVDNNEQIKYFLIKYCLQNLLKESNNDQTSLNIILASSFTQNNEILSQQPVFEQGRVITENDLISKINSLDSSKTALKNRLENAQYVLFRVIFSALQEDTEDIESLFKTSGLIFIKYKKTTKDMTLDEACTFFLQQYSDSSKINLRLVQKWIRGIQLNEGLKNIYQIQNPNIISIDAIQAKIDELSEDKNNYYSDIIEDPAFRLLYSWYTRKMEIASMREFAVMVKKYNQLLIKLGKDIYTGYVILDNFFEAEIFVMKTWTKEEYNSFRDFVVDLELAV